MLTIEPTGAVLGATVRGIDLARPLREPDLGRRLLALGKHGVLRFPDQHLDLGALKRFSEQFGEIQGGSLRRRVEPQHALVSADRECPSSGRAGCAAPVSTSCSPMITRVMKITPCTPSPRRTCRRA
jgi:alpha-ketoglutarate-dependent taurine dioxygenase